MDINREVFKECVKKGLEEREEQMKTPFEKRVNIKRVEIKREWEKRESEIKGYIQRMEQQKETMERLMEKGEQRIREAMDRVIDRDKWVMDLLIAKVTNGIEDIQDEATVKRKINQVINNSRMEKQIRK